MARLKSTSRDTNNQNFLDRLQLDLENRQSLISLVLGVLIVAVVAILAYNYFNRGTGDLGPSITTEEEQGDVAKENLPGKYTVKEDDTLFLIAQKYYEDGYKFTEIAKTNNLADPNAIEVGQVLEIPKVEGDQVLAEASPSPSATPSPTPEQVTQVSPKQVQDGKGGAENVTIWGEKITGNTYTVVQDDWLSKIAGRAYGDIMAYQKIAEANNISDPDLILPGMVLKIPR